MLFFTFFYYPRNEMLLRFYPHARKILIVPKLLLNCCSIIALAIGQPKANFSKISAEHKVWKKESSTNFFQVSVIVIWLISLQPGLLHFLLSSGLQEFLLIIRFCCLEILEIVCVGWLFYCGLKVLFNVIEVGKGKIRSTEKIPVEYIVIVLD